MGSRMRVGYIVPVLLGMLMVAGKGVEAQEADSLSAPAVEEVQILGSQLGPNPEQARLLPAAPLAGGVTASHEARVGPGVGTVVQRRGGPVSLMAAGGVLLFAGAIIGGDAGTLVMVGGAGALAWGAYLYF